MSNPKSFPFNKARRVTEKEVVSARKALEEKLNQKRPSRGRPPSGDEKHTPVSIRLHPKALEWAKMEAKKQGVGYQTVINQVLLKKAV